MTINSPSQAIQELVNPTAGHRDRLAFMPWLGEKGFKIGVVGEPPVVPQGFMAASDRQGCLLGNTTAVRTLFMRQYTKFLKLFYHKAYVWQFLDSNGELEMFFEAKERVSELIADYEEMLGKCVEQEKSANTNLSLVGSSRAAGAAGAGAPAGGATVAGA